MTNGQGGTAHSFPCPPDPRSAVPPASLDRQKDLARTRARRTRDLAARGEAAQRAGAILCQRVLATQALPKGCAVSAYWPMASEIDPRPLMAALHGLGHAIALPAVRGRGMPLAFRTWTPGLALVPGGFGTQVPGPGQPELVPQVLLVPLLAFDRQGYRLGYGGGFYDRTLAALRAAGPVCALGLAYSAQEVETVPRGEHDQRLDWIVTETGSYAMNGAAP